MTEHRSRALAAPLAALALLVAACGDDDGDSASDTTEAAEASTEDATAQGDLTAFCDSAIEGEALFQRGPESEGDGPPTDEALEAFAADLLPLVDEMEASAPEEVAEDAATVADGVRTSVEQGDYEAGITDAVIAADAAVDAYVFEHCEMAEEVDVVAQEYAFDGLPAELPAGRVGIRFTNDGRELHEAAFLRIVDGEERSVEELLSLPEEEAQQLAVPVAGIQAGPGEERAAVLDLEPGRYAVVCFVPVGTTSMDQEPAEDAPPHAAQGMATEVVVR